ncbi:MAG: hypothetical protein EOP88_12205 [Verrucomicrobiaceae bacterium]|nr:MAG: hypothetical protein EOP88_12205 [Verrucomicrobiaceae bacterium]
MIHILRSRPGMAVHNGDFYAGHDGNIYRKDDGQWSKWDDGGWKPVDHDGRGSRQRPDFDPGKRPQPSDRNGFISGQTRHPLPGYDGGVRPGAGGAGERNPALEPSRPGAGGSGERNPALEPSRPGAGGAGERNPALTPSRPGTGGSGERNPELPARQVTDPGEVRNRLDREASTRDRGEDRFNQFQSRRASGGGFQPDNGSRFQGFQGGGNRFQGGGRRGGGGLRHR